MNEREKLLFELCFKRKMGFSVEKAIETVFQTYEAMASHASVKGSNVVIVVDSEEKAKMMTRVIHEHFVTVEATIDKGHASCISWMFNVVDQFTVSLDFRRSYFAISDPNWKLTDIERNALERITGITVEQLQKELEEVLSHSKVDTKRNSILWKSMKLSHFRAHRIMVAHLFKNVHMYRDYDHDSGFSSTSIFSSGTAIKEDKKDEIVEVYLTF